MQLSAFNLYVDGYPEVGQTLVHNTFSGAYLVLDSRVVAALEKAERGDDLDEAERALIADPDLRDPDVAVVVESRDAEDAEYRAWFQHGRAQPTLQAIVGINLACNFDCPYCCQAEVMNGSVMSWETVSHTARWLAERARAVGVDRIHVPFVGGEPLLHPDRIERLVTELGAEAGEGITVTFALITNGYFLTPEMVARLAPLGLTHAQVTLDGDAHTHSRTRVSKKGEDTFQRIFDNVVAASRTIRLTINGNYQDDTISGFGPLIEKLAAAGLAERSKVGFSPALETLASPEGSGSGSCSWSGSSAMYQVALYDASAAAGWRPNQLHAVGPCAFHNVNNFAIDPDGRIFKCPGFLGHPDWNIGHVAGGLEPERHERIVALDTQSDCGGCAHRPNCAGGCVAAVWIERGEAVGVNCERDYFEAVKGDSLVREFLIATSETIEDAVAAFPPAPVSLPPPGSAAPPAKGVRPASLKVLAA
jgi:uncharacterized protein